MPGATFAALTAVDNMTDAERNTAVMIQDLCPKMVVQNALVPYEGSELQLLRECRALVQTSNTLPGEAGPTGNSLGYNNDQLREALSQVAHQEVAVQANAATDTIDGQFDTIASRMSALRRGGAGSGIGGLSLMIDGQTLPLAGLIGGAAGDESSGWSLYLNGNYNFGDSETTSRESGFDYDNYGVTFGADKRIDPTTTLGAALGFAQTESDISQNGGTTDDESASFSLYGTKQFGNNVYLDAIGTYGTADYDTLRRVRLPTPTTPVANVFTDDDIKASTEGEQTAFSIGIGRDYHSASNKLDYGFFGRAQVYRSKIDAYSETGNGQTALELDVSEQVVDSTKLSLGGQISKPLSRSFGVLVPQARFEYFHELENDSRNITARYVNTPSNVTGDVTGDFHFFVPTDNPDRDFMTIGLGVSAVLQSGTQLFGFYETTAGLDNITNHSVIFGVRGEF